MTRCHAAGLIASLVGLALTMSGCQLTYSRSPAVTEDEIEPVQQLVGIWIMHDTDEDADDHEARNAAKQSEQKFLWILPADDSRMHPTIEGELDEHGVPVLKDDEKAERDAELFMALKRTDAGFVGHITGKNLVDGWQENTPAFLPFRLEFRDDDTFLIRLLNSEALRDTAGFDDPPEGDAIRDFLNGVEREPQVPDKLDALPIECIVVGEDLVITAATDELQAFLVKEPNEWIADPIEFRRFIPKNQAQ